MVAGVISLIILLGISLQTFAAANTAMGRQPQAQAVVLGVDAGTESLRAVLFDKDGQVVSSQVCEYPSGTQFPKNGWLGKYLTCYVTSMAIPTYSLCVPVGQNNYQKIGGVL